MAHYLISYDLHNQRHYQPVWDWLNQVGGTRLLESLWVATLNLSAVQIRDALEQRVDQDDSIVVIELKAGSYWATRLAKTLGMQWLQKNIMA